ncbi:2,4'-dihydroxyacetophenone dioxygenase [Alteromonas aestuariivivens]|uniref:2,4'-dihydroxyacetophenone dioxygenase n=1 Tax=Alteromonas aestuariivivens TaxID=1938339 RepID=A0A3D8MDJ1_9ALTE|nr:2,4'-dihydroxyacetophenone dioxygenase family protein [Alteromonas aestuariivivens]RDV28919.1 2,4'-dihydroxyacetophenone dioxygenase [Alteromonas aestuariivivens]
MPLPDMVNHLEHLLCVHTEQEKLIQNVLPGVHLYPLVLDTENGLWVLRVQFEPGVTLPKHFHTGIVHLYTLSGCWHYIEYPEDKQVAGSYLFEPGGSIHTFHTPQSNEGLTDTFMVVNGANINFDENGNFVNIMDAGWIEQVMLAAAEAQDITPHYIKPKAHYDFSGG